MSRTEWLALLDQGPRVVLCDAASLARLLRELMDLRISLGMDPGA